MLFIEFFCDNSENINSGLNKFSKEEGLFLYKFDISLQAYIDNSEDKIKDRNVKQSLYSQND